PRRELSGCSLASQTFPLKSHVFVLHPKPLCNRAGLSFFARGPLTGRSGSMTRERGGEKGAAMERDEATREVVGRLLEIIGGECRRAGPEAGAYAKEFRETAEALKDLAPESPATTKGVLRGVGDLHERHARWLDRLASVLRVAGDEELAQLLLEQKLRSPFGEKLREVLVENQ